MKRICLVSLALAALLGAGCNKDRTADNTAVGTSGRGESKVSSGDRDFIHDVAMANTAEIDLARMAADRSTNQDVKNFAQKMIADHTAVGDKLNAVAFESAVTLPAKVDDTHQSLRDKLAKRQGLDFDRDYIDAMVDDHQKFVDKLESRIDKTTLSKWKTETTDHRAPDQPRIEGKAQMIVPEKSDDPVTQRINQWAADTYPTAYAHLESAKALKDVLKKRLTD